MPKCQIDSIVKRLTNGGEPTLFFIGGAEFSPNSPIKGHVRCPSIRKLPRAVARYKNTDCIYVDEFHTSQRCGQCLTKFPKSTKFFRFKKCGHCGDTPELELQKVPTIITRESKRNRQHHRQQTRTQAQRSRRFLYNGSTEIKNTTWHRDICTCSCIRYKGSKTLLQLPIDERLMQSSRSNDDEDSDDDTSMAQPGSIRVIW